MTNILEELQQAAADTNQDSIESDGPQFPVIQWHYGSLKAKRIGGMDYHGGWFIGGNMADMTGVPGWEATTWTHHNGDESEGFYCRELTVSLIRLRERWEVQQGAKRFNFAQKKYGDAKELGRAIGRIHVLVLIKGLEDKGPFVLTLKGSASMAFKGTRTQLGAMQLFSRTVIKAANDMLKKSKKEDLLPHRAFWLTVGGDRNAKGEPVFTEVGSGTDKSSIVLPVAIGLPDKAENADLKLFFVGKTTYATVNQIWEDNATWKTAWDVITPGSTDQPQNGKAEPAPEPEEDLATSMGL